MLITRFVLGWWASLLLQLQLLSFLAAFNGVADYKSGELLERDWLEVGFVDLDDAKWVTVRTKSLELNANNNSHVAVFISLPAYGGDNCETYLF